MLKIKLIRLGKNKSAFYRIAVVEENSKLTGSPTEYLGHYNPKSKDLQFDKTKLNAWLKKGAQPTATVRKLCLTS